ncbi:fimbrial protein [Erwinia sp. BC051422]|uniref:fimbrial protein n=1 Tax=Erwinia wuhanensis TaxID=3045167 RepID=UPI002654796E|nr:fimbrial protein [Erwinia sp. BC051422]MDN8541616.1 fimbrial protein [Erwinia sp. BC051422]
MKKLLIAAALATAFTGVTAQAASTDSSGTITFNGELTATTCKVNVNGSGNSDGDVTLPVLQNTALPSQGATAGDTAFNMQLTDCTLADGMTAVSAYFQDGVTVNPYGRLTNQSTATEKSNVTLELLDRTQSNANVITIGSNSQISNAIYETVKDNAATLNYSVRYYAEEEGVASAGMVSSSVVYALQYK